jgi:putative serine protease PepD
MSTTPEDDRSQAGTPEQPQAAASTPAEATTPVPQTPVAEASAHPQEAPTQRIDPAVTQRLETTPAAPDVAPTAPAPAAAPAQPAAAAPTPAQPVAPQPAAPVYPAPAGYPAAGYGAPQAAPQQPQPRYGQYAPQQPAAQTPAPQAPAPAPVPQPVAGTAQGHDPLAAFRRPDATGPGMPGGTLPPQDAQPGPDGQQPLAAGTTVRSERTRFWLPVVGVGVTAALVASLATAGIFVAIDGNGSSSTRAADISSIGQTSTDSVPVSGSTSDNPDWQAVSAAVSASVVAIQVTTSSGEAEGSGVIIDDAGHIVTNNHVVSGAQDDKVQVTLTDGRIFTADVVGTDATTDLAVVKIEDAPDDLSPAALGDSSDVAVGDPVMAVGNPLGLANTVTTGIVSALDRPVSTSESGSETVVTNAIQIDAAVNPGNSGGPLFDAQGRVVGITASLATTSSQSGSIGLGFAIPVNLATMISSQLIADGTAEHAFLGLGLADGTATADGVTRAGALVKTVSTGSPAADAGIQTKDTIVAIDGKAVAGAESLTGYVRAHASGDQVTLTLVRDGKSLEVDVTLATREETSTSSGSGSGSSGSGDQGSGQGDSGSGDSGSSGQGGLENMTPEQLWEWFQQQQQQQGGGNG